MADDDLLSELLALDERFFEPGAGRALYEEALADPSLMVVPGPPPLDRAAALDAAAQSEGGAGWTSHEIHDGARLLRLGPDVASITYRATAVRDGPGSVPRPVHQRVRPRGWRLEARPPPADPGPVRRRRLIGSASGQAAPSRRTWAIGGRSSMTIGVAPSGR